MAGLKKSEIALKVFEVVEPLSLAPVSGGPLHVAVADLSALALVPWFCDGSVQWALRISSATAPFTKSPIKKVNAAFNSIVDGRLCVAVAGDGIAPPSYTLNPLALAIAEFSTPGVRVELAAANLGVVKRDWDVKAESATADGNQRYVGLVGTDRSWAIESSTPALTASQLELAIDCGRTFVNRGPWEVRDKTEAFAILMEWMSSFQANINPAAVKAMLALRDLRFAQPEGQAAWKGVANLDDKLYGLALGYFRHRLAGGPFHWHEAIPTGHSTESLEAVARAVIGEM